jgi:hypothetical protein
VQARARCPDYHCNLRVGWGGWQRRAGRAELKPAPASLARSPENSFYPSRAGGFLQVLQEPVQV